MHNDSSVIDQFRAAMRAQGIHTRDDIEGDGKIHRCHVEGDRKGSKNGWYCLHVDEHPAGMFGCNKRHGSHKFSWSAKRNSKPLTAEERKALRERNERQRAEKLAAERARHAAAAERAQAIWAASAPATDDHPYLKRKGVKAHGLRLGKWEVINTETGEVRQISNHALLVPICDRTRKLHNLQAIFPKKLMSGGTRDKDYMRDGAKIGFFHAIGAPKEVDGRKVFIIVEGYATGASVHECTGHCVLVTFDTSNLMPVAKQLRERLPEALIVFAADNDQFTHEPVPNPGVTYAKVAAQQVGGIVAVPQFADLAGEPTDFNDLHLRQGTEAVASQIMAVLNLESAIEHVEHEETPPWDDIPPDAYADEQPAEDGDPATSPAPAAPLAPVGEFDDDELTKHSGFTILGYDGGDYFLFSHSKRQVVSITKRDITDIGLIELAGPNFWEEFFSDGRGGINRKAVAHWIFSVAHARGIYDPTRVRGRGAWTDSGRAVYHHGDYLTVDGQRTDVHLIQSGYVYPMARRLPEPAAQPLTDAEGAHLISVAGLARWSMPASAALMSGWAMLAPICGALSWRPHIWLSGGAGTGKTTLQKQFCGALTRGVHVYANGNSTEAGIRQELKGDALPCLIDEFESNNEREKARVESIMSMIRQTSSETQAKTLKGTITGTGMHYDIRSMFCLASINTNLPTKADVDRLSILTLKPASPMAPDNWERLKAELNAIDMDATISSRLLARALSLMPVILQSVDVFRRVAGKHFERQRDGDQYGTLLAGAWCLQKSAVPTEDEALTMIDAYDWSEHLESHDEDDAMRALEAIMSAKIRVGPAGDMSVYELVRESSQTYRHGSVDRQVADDTLRRHGIRVETGTEELWFGTGVSSLQQLVKGTSFVTDLRGQLLRVKGAKRLDKSKKFNGIDSKVVTIPMGMIMSEEREQQGPPI